MIAPNSSMDLFSHSQLSQTGWKIRYLHKNNMYKISKGTNVFYFLPRNRLFQAPHESIFVQPNTSNTTSKIVANTRTTNPTLTSTQIKGAVEAKQLHEALGHPSDGVLCSMIKNATQQHFNVSVSDVLNMNKHFGPCQSCIRGKLARAPSITSKSMKSTIPAEKLHLDIMFLRLRSGETNGYLLTVDEATGHITTTPLKNKSREELTNAITEVVSLYREYGHHVRMICADQEKGINIEDMANLQITISRVSAEQHEKQAERNIRTLRDTVRTLTVDAPCGIPAQFAKYAVSWATSCLNLRPNVHCAPETCPMSIITGNQTLLCHACSV
jgi:hypothetical protein